MSYKIVLTPFFEREFKKLSKKYVSLKSDLSAVVKSLYENPELGESIGANCYKIRIAISSKNRGKSGGARLITYVRFVNEEIYLISIYDKSDLSTLAEEELIKRLKHING